MNTGWMRNEYWLDEEWIPVECGMKTGWIRQKIQVGWGMNKGWIRNEFRLDKEWIYAGWEINTS